MTPSDLKAAAAALDFTPTEMARAMGVSYATYKNWQSGRRRLPAVAIRCVRLLCAHPITARRFADK